MIVLADPFNTLSLIPLQETMAIVTQSLPTMTDNPATLNMVETTWENHATLNGDSTRHTKPKFYRNATPTEHPPEGPLHRTNHRVRTLNIISNNKRQIFGDQLLAGS